jgi:mannose/fructose/N-acetylgalactosamine-specific phosphotransferase system component IIC
MKRVIGYTLFWFALGMLVMLVLSDEFVGIALIGICLFLSYYMSCC